MGFFEKIFNKGNEELSSQKSESNSLKKSILESEDIKNYSFKRIEPERLKGIIEDCNEFIPIVDKLTDRKFKNRLHPENLLIIGKLWLEMNVDKELLISKLGACYGQYLCMQLGFNWIWAGDLRTSKNENLSVKLALVDSGNKNIILPFDVLRKEFMMEQGYLLNHFHETESKFYIGRGNLSSLSFEELVQYGKRSGGIVDVLSIWNKIIQLPKLYFVCTHRENIQETTPFVGLIDNTPWVFVFTSDEKAKTFALETFPGEEFSVLIQNTEDAIRTILSFKLDGVFGVRINDIDSKINANINAPLHIVERFIEDIRTPAINEFLY
jgi:hypothetical protein